MYLSAIINFGRLVNSTLANPQFSHFCQQGNVKFPPIWKTLRVRLVYVFMNKRNQGNMTPFKQHCVPLNRPLDHSRACAGIAGMLGAVSVRP